MKELADFIQVSEPYIIEFSAQNIWRMKQFYETYSKNEKLATLQATHLKTRMFLSCTYQRIKECKCNRSYKEKSQP